MAIPTWTAGQVLTASDVNTYFVPQVKIKLADEAVVSSVTAQNDDDLFFSVSANATYWIEVLVRYTAAPAADLRNAISFPAGAIFNGWVDRLIPTAADEGDHRAAEAFDGATFDAGGLGTNTLTVLPFSGMLRVSSTSGTFRYMWAQAVSNAAATTVKAGSVLMAWRIA